MASSVLVPLGPAKVNITGIRAGDRNEMQFTFTSNGGPLDLTGQTLTAQARLKTTSPTAALTAVITIIGSPTAGVARVRWPGDDVRTMLAGKESWSGVWDMQVDNGVDDPVTLAAGTFKAEMDVTRP